MVLTIKPSSSPPAFDHLQYDKKQQEGLVNLTTWTAAWGVTFYKYSRGMENSILHSVLHVAMKMRQAAMENNKHTNHIQGRRHSSEGLPNNLCEISAVWQDEANTAKKNPSGVLLQSWICHRGRTSLDWNLSCFSSFSVAGDINVNMSPCLESVTSPLAQITW